MRAEEFINAKPTEMDLARGERLWLETREPDDDPWAELPEGQRNYGAILSRLVQDRNRLFECGVCYDRVMVLQEKGGTWFCDTCTAGFAAEAGYWAGRSKKSKGGAASRDKRAFQERLRTHPAGMALRERVEAILGEG